MRNNNEYLYYFILIGCFKSIATHYYYPELKSSSPSSYTIYEGKKVDGNTNMVETYKDYIDCITACKNKKEMCKSIEANIVDKVTTICRFFNNENPNTIQADGFIYISFKEPSCSVSCNLSPNPCGKCNCYPSCAARNRRQYVCNSAGLAKSCQEHYLNGWTKTGIFQISINGIAMETLCEMEKVEFQNPTDIVVRYINERKVIQNNWVTTLPLLKMTYSISFMFKPSFIPNNPVNTIHLTNGLLYGSYWNRFPAVFFAKGSSQKGFIFVSSEVNGNGDYVVLTNEIPLNVWSSIQVSQTESNGIYTYTVCLNGTVVESIVNTMPKSFTDVEVYNGDPWYGSYTPCISVNDLIVINGNEYPWYNAQNGFIDVLNNISKSNGVWIPMMTRFAGWESSFWNRRYEEYENGFGLLNQQWIGLKKLNQITSQFFTDMRVDYFLRKDLAFSTMYYNVFIGSSNSNYTFSYNGYDSRSSLEPDLFNANSTAFQSCNNWWTNTCVQNMTPTSTNYISYGSTEDLFSIQFLLRTKENRVD